MTSTADSPVSRYHLPGTRTDRLAQGPRTVYADGGGCLIADTPSFRESNWRHRLILAQEPGDDLWRWFLRWQEAHQGKGIKKAILTFEDEVEAPCEGEGGFQHRLEGLVGWPSAQGVVIRALRGGEWAAAEALDLAINAGEGPSEVAHAARAWALRREGVQEGWMRQWGAFVDWRLVGLAALAEGEREARFQDVEVDEAFRRRGIARALVGSLSADAGRRRPGRDVWINALIGSSAQRIYRGLGFVFASRQRWWTVDAPVGAEEIRERWARLQAGDGGLVEGAGPG